MAQNGQAGRTEYRHDTSRRVPDKGEGTNTGMKREKGDTGDIRYMPFPVRLFAPSPGNGTGDGNGALSGKHRDGKRGGLVRFIAGNPPAGGSPETGILFFAGQWRGGRKGEYPPRRNG